MRSSRGILDVALSDYGVDTFVESGLEVSLLIPFFTSLGLQTIHKKTSITTVPVATIVKFESLIVFLRVYYL